MWKFTWIIPTQCISLCRQESSSRRNPFRSAVHLEHCTVAILFFLPLSLYWTPGSVAGRSRCSAAGFSSSFSSYHKDAAGGLRSGATYITVTVPQTVSCLQTGVQWKQQNLPPPRKLFFAVVCQSVIFLFPPFLCEVFHSIYLRVLQGAEYPPSFQRWLQGHERNPLHQASCVQYSVA